MPLGSKLKGGMAVLTISLIVLLACAEEQDTRPPTFGLACSTDSDCAAPFTCLPTGTGLRCTNRCTETPDCPAWHETGHCDGDRQAPCKTGVCEPLFCK